MSYVSSFAFVIESSCLVISIVNVAEVVCVVCCCSVVC